MASSIQLAILIIAVLVAPFYFSRATAVGGTPPSSTPFVADDLPDSSTLFEPILSNLGFKKLAMAVRSLSNDSVFTTWNGTYTLFAPTDASIRSCFNCSITRLLREHTVPGLFSHDYLRRLAPDSKIKTIDPARCITVTSNNSKIYINGVEITRPDLLNNGLVVVHGLQGYIAPLSQFSCNHNQQSDSIMQLMIHDAMLRLGNSGYNVLANAFNINYAELVNLQSMTIFAVDDVSIYSGKSHSYVSNIRFHIIPNRLLAISDLEKLPVGTFLPTLVPGQSLAITAAAATGIAPMRINYVSIKIPDVLRNSKIVVHSVNIPFSYLHRHSVFASASTSTTTSYYDDDEINGGDASSNFDDRAAENKNEKFFGSCATNTFEKDAHVKPRAMFDTLILKSSV